MAKASKAETGTATVTVALKHPTGIIIEAFTQDVAHEPVMGGGTREVTVFRSTGKQYTINGNRAPFGVRPDFDIVAGYGLTHGVPKDVWERWLEQHHDSPLVQNNLICAHESVDHVKDEARDGAKLKSGLEPMLQKGDPRAPKKMDRQRKFVDAIEVADEQPKAA